MDSYSGNALCISPKMVTLKILEHSPQSLSVSSRMTNHWVLMVLMLSPSLCPPCQPLKASTNFNFHSTDLIYQTPFLFILFFYFSSIFNIHVDNDSDTKVRPFNLLDCIDFIQHVNDSTHDLVRTLDLEIL